MTAGRKARADKLIAAVGFYLLLQVVALVGATRRVINEPDSLNAFYFWFYLGRLAFLTMAIVLSFVRSNQRFYVPTLYELSHEDYWSLVFMTMASVKLLFARFFIQLSSNLVVEYSILAFLITHMLMKYQSQIWIFEKKKEREKRIFRLVRKASISKDEFEAARPYLIDKGRKNQRPPWIWKVTVFFTVIIIGAMLNALASDIADAFGSPFGL